MTDPVSHPEPHAPPPAPPPADPSRQPPPARRTGPRILIVRPSALGDVARTVPALVSLRQAHPDATIHWLVNAPFADAVCHHPALDGVVAFDRRRLGRVTAVGAALAFGRQLRRGGYDLAYDLQGLLRSGLMTFATRARKRVGFANARECGWLGYTHRYAVDPRPHAVDRMLALLQHDGLATTDDMRLYVGADDAAWWDAQLAAQDAAGDRYACLAPTAAWRCKCWPIERYTTIARRLLDVVPRVVVLASPSEAAQVRPLQLSMKEHEAAGRLLVPRTTVGQAMAILSRAAVVVCNDSAALHLAVGLDRPTVAIFGPTDYARVGPYRRDDDVVTPPHTPHGDARGYRHRHDQSLIARIDPDTVWHRVRQRLNG